MADTRQNEASRVPAIAVLRDVRSLSGRGTVRVFARIQGVIRAGDDTGLPNGSVEARGPVQVRGPR